MILIENMKNLKIYKKPMFFPTLAKNKKKGAAILLMTPNIKSSIDLLNNKLFINKLRYQSYFIDKDISYLVNDKELKNSITEEVVSTNPNYFLSSLNESALDIGDQILFFNEDSVYNSQIRRIIYNDRLKVRKDVLNLYDIIAPQVSYIKYTYPDIEKYLNRNLFIDYYYYNELFFKNNTWVSKKGMNLYKDFMSRLIDSPSLKKSGYTKKTIFIPVKDWDTTHNDKSWDYRINLSPISIIYYLLYNDMERALSLIFRDINVVFVGNNSYFKINFSELDNKKYKAYATKFKKFINIICKNEEFDDEDIDTTLDNGTPDAIKASIVDKIEQSKGVDITPQIVKVEDKKKELSKNKNIAVPDKEFTTSQDKANKDIIAKNSNEENDKVVSKGTLNQKKTDSDLNTEKDLDTLASAIVDASDRSASEEEAINDLDKDYIKKILMDLDSKAEDKVDITSGRASRISELDKKLMTNEVKGRTVKDILEEKPKEDEVTSLNIASPNEEWKDLKFVNFNKDFDIDKYIIEIFKFFETTSRPISIRNIEVTNNSTSEDRVELYKVEMEDYRGKRFTIKLDIPIMVDNRFLLRGNNKSIQTQFFNMPIIKTDLDTCQIISNYMKIFVRRFGTGSGKSLLTTSKFIKAASKYNGRNIKFIYGDNTKICTKYELPIDYIDLAGIFSRIETKDFIIYFNQDEIRSLYTIEEEKGIPFAFYKKQNEIKYLDLNYTTVTQTLISMLLYENRDFYDLFKSASHPSVCTYSRASIMNSEIPLVVICAYHEGLRKVLEKANIKYRLVASLTKEARENYTEDRIKFKDGYLIYDLNYESSLLLNGLKDCPTEFFELSDIDNKNMYLEFLDSFGGRIKADGLENFYDLEIDPITKKVLEFYKFPTDYVSILLYANALLADNKYIKHTDTSSRRLRRYELIAVYTYKVLADEYASYANQLKHSREAAEFSVKQSAVIDKFLTDSITSDDSCINALRDLETTNAITTKGPSGMNTDRAYSLDKRTYDESMLNVLGMSTGFAANVGITRQATMNANIEGELGYVKSIHGDTEKMNTASTLTATEALTPFGTTRDDPIRTAMTFIQTAKHAVRTEDSDPLLVTNGADEALPYLSSDKFAFKAKNNGKIQEINNSYILVSYDDGSKDYINLEESIEKNSDGGYYVPLKLDAIDKLQVGSKIKKNQILAYDKYSYSNSVGESDNIAYNIGKLAKVAIINTDEGFEDSGIITESMAKKLATRVNLKFEVTLDKNTNIISMAKVGDHIECRDSLLVYQSPFDDEDTNALLKSLAQDDVSELGKRKLVSEVTGTLKGIKIYRTVELDEMSDSLRKIVSDYEKPLIQKEKILKANNIDISQIPAHYVLPPTGKLKKAVDAVVIEFYVEYLDTVGIGDKVVYFSANKAVEKNVIPLGKEPYTDFRPNEKIDAFVSEVSIDKRMVTSSINYGALQKLMIELDRSVKDILGIKYDDSTV